jgi:hypothetical protein
MNLSKATQVQAAIDASFELRIPVGEATELDLSDLMPYERQALPEAVAAFCRAFDDTVTGELQ